MSQRLIDFGFALAWLTQLAVVGNAMAHSDIWTFLLALPGLISVSWYIIKIGSYKSPRS